MLRIISHRGNLNGPNSAHENEPLYIMQAIYAGFDAEVDLWCIPGGLFLGHDQPTYRIEYYFLVNKHLWIHCKNLEALVYLSNDECLNLVFHKKDIAVTTKGFLWTAPGLLVGNNSIAVMPEKVKSWDIKDAYGVCTDYPNRYLK